MAKKTSASIVDVSVVLLASIALAQVWTDFVPHPWGALLCASSLMLPMFAAGNSCLDFCRKEIRANKCLSLAWAILAICFASFATSQSLYGFSALAEGSAPQLESVGDLMSSIGAIFGAAGLIIMIRSRVGKDRLRVLVDSLSLGITGCLVVWRTVYDSPASITSSDQVQAILAMALPPVMMIMTWAAVTNFCVSLYHKSQRFGSGLLAIGCLVYSGTTLFGRLAEQSDFAYLFPVAFSGWVTSFFILYLGMRFIADGPAEVPSEGIDSKSWTDKLSDSFAFATPYAITFGTLLIFLAQDIILSGTPSSLVFSAIIISATLLAVRHVITLLEKQFEISVIAESLEQTVQKRTKQLEARYQLARAVNTTPDIESFCDSAADHTMNIFEADGLILVVNPGILITHPRGYCVSRAFGYDALEMLGESAFVSDSFLTTDTLRMLVGEDWRAVSCLRVPLRAINQVYGSIFAVRIEEKFSAEDKSSFEAIGLEMAAALGHNIMYAKAVEASEKDYLTEMLNHRAISRKLQTLISNDTSKSEIGVMLVDVGGFKLFNDTYGHAAGDDVLRCIAGRLFEIVRPLGGFVGRTGGDEFMVLLPNFKVSESYKVASSVQRAVAGIDFRISGYDEKLPLEVNIGLASYPESGENPYTILAAADANLNEAKLNRVTFLEERSIGPAHREDRNTSMEAVEMMLTAIDNVDSYTKRHSLDVTKYATWLAEELGSSVGTVEQVASAAMLHDVGKIAVPTSILRKPGSLTDEEFELMKRHTTIGAMIVQAMPNMHDIVDGVKYHHERYDGTGYPDGLAGENIPFLGRLLAVADAFSAMTTDRPYRKGMDWPEAARRLKAGSGTQFDPRMASAFLKVLEARGVPMDEGTDKAA